MAEYAGRKLLAAQECLSDDESVEAASSTARLAPARRGLAAVRHHLMRAGQTALLSLAVVLALSCVIAVFWHARASSKLVRATGNAPMTDRGFTLVSVRATGNASMTDRGVALASIEDFQLDLTAARRDKCTGCDFTVDLRCQGLPLGLNSRTAFYHRLVECLLPLYGMVRLAQQASFDSSVNVCALTWLRKGRDLHELLTKLVGVKWHALVDEDDECAAGLEYHAAYRPFNTTYRCEERRMCSSPSSEAYLSTFGDDPNMLRAYSINVANNFHWLSSDIRQLLAENAKKPSGRFHVVMQRKGYSRCFTADALRNLTAIEYKVGGGVIRKKLETLVYFGNESLLDTVKYFANAAVVTGYHGAGFANAITFTSQRYCVLHISNAWKKWRAWIFQEAFKINPFAQLNLHFIPLLSFLQVNSVAKDDFLQSEDKDHLIKDLPWVPLDSTDIADVRFITEICLREWVDGQ